MIGIGIALLVVLALISDLGSGVHWRAGGAIAILLLIWIIGSIAEKCRKHSKLYKSTKAAYKREYPNMSDKQIEAMMERNAEALHRKLMKDGWDV